MLATLLSRAVKRIKNNPILGGDRTVYMDRFGLLDVRLHCIRRSDEDKELHDHPWLFACAVILSGGYREEFRVGNEVHVRDVRPGMVNVIRGSTFHRVDLLNGPSWSFFVAGPIVKSWGFWNRVTEKYTPWKDFIRAKGLTPRGEQ